MITALFEGKDLSQWQERRPDWWQYIEHSIVLHKQGAAAATLYHYPTTSPDWQAAQQILAALWFKADVQFKRASLKPHCPFMQGND